MVVLVFQVWAEHPEIMDCAGGISQKVSDTSKILCGNKVSGN